MRITAFLTFLLGLTFLPGMVLAGAGDCVTLQVDKGYFGDWETVTGYAMTTFTSNCPESVYDSAAGVVRNPLSLVFRIYDTDHQEWREVGTLSVAPASGRPVRERVFSLDPGVLASGRYRVDVINGGQLLESIVFAVGTVDRPAPGALTLQLPYVKPAAVAVGGNLYFRGFLPPGRNRGFLYQPRWDRTEILPVEFEAVNPQDGNAFVNAVHVRGGALDLPWVRVKLPNNTFDPARPIYASVSGPYGLTVNAVVYDPADPAQLFFGFR